MWWKMEMHLVVFVLTLRLESESESALQGDSGGIHDSGARGHIGKFHVGDHHLR